MQGENNVLGILQRVTIKQEFPFCKITHFVFKNLYSNVFNKIYLFIFRSEGECTTSGISDLEQQCQFYKSFECHFAKWRCVYRVGDNLPSSLAIFNNAEILARFANVCQYHRYEKTKKISKLI